MFCYENEMYMSMSVSWTNYMDAYFIFLSPNFMILNYQNYETKNIKNQNRYMKKIYRFFWLKKIEKSVY